MLNLQGLTVERGPVTVLDRIDVRVDSHRLLGVFGQNGAGKSTLLFAVCGLIPIRAGQVFLDGRPVEGLSPQRMLRLGVALVPQGRRVFAGLTVRQNLELGGQSVGNRATLAARVDAYLDRHPRLARRADTVSGALSGGEQGLCVLGRALMSEPSVLLLDEPLMGLSPAAGQDVLAQLRQTADEGRTVLVVEHNRAAVAQYADHMIEIVDGKTVPWK